MAVIGACVTVGFAIRPPTNEWLDARLPLFFGPGSWALVEPEDEEYTGLYALPTPDGRWEACWMGETILRHDRPILLRRLWEAGRKIEIEWAQLMMGDALLSDSQKAET